jgi:hypothetical protein
MEVSPTLRSGLSIGNVAAEFDRELFEVFVDNGNYESIRDLDNRRCFVIGRTGAGKSAAFSQLTRQESDYVIRIHPDELAFQYLTNTNVIQQLSILGVELSPFFRALWQHILIVEILRKKYKLDNEADKTSLFNRFLRQSTSTRARETALKYLSDFGTSFWETAEVRVQEITERFEKEITDEATRIEASVNSGPVAATVSGSLGNSVTGSSETTVKKEIREKYQVIVNRMQAPRMAEVTRLLDETVLQNPYDALYVVIDDLDREWSDSTIRINLIKCLFDSVMEMQRRIHNLKVLVALRTNLFEQLGYETSQYHQVEKLRDLILELSWSRADLRVLVETRLSKMSIKEVIEPSVSIKSLLPKSDDNPEKTGQDPFDWILDRTLLRPRDVIVWINEVLTEASGKSGLSWNDLYQVAERVSKFRLMDLRDEWMEPYLGIEGLLNCFHGYPAELKLTEFSDIVDLDVFNLVGEQGFKGAHWLDPMIQSIYMADGTDNQRDWAQYYGDIALLLWKISFLGIDAKGDGRVSYSYEQDQTPNLRDLDTEYSLMVIHPAFRAALGNS